MKKIAVVMGGMSSEREVSLRTGACIQASLLRLGYDVRAFDLTADIYSFLNDLKQYGPDVIFNALYGCFGEDGCVQGLFNLLHIPYTYSGVLASSIGMNKEKTKQLARQLGVPVAKGGLKTLEQMKKNQFPFPYVVKPNDGGSSVGVVIVHNIQEQNDLFKTWSKDQVRLVEEYIKGRELSAAVLNNSYLGDIEIIPHTGFYDYKNKYTAGKTTHITPAQIPSNIRSLIKKYALAIHKTLGCRGASRCDFIVDDANPKKPKLVFLEINTNPGMTDISLVPDIAKHKKIEYDALVEQLIAEARCD